MSWQDDPVQYNVVNGVTTATGTLGGQSGTFVLTTAAPGTFPGGYAGGSQAFVLQQPAPSFGLSSAGISTVTGVNPNETSYSLYGHTIPLSVFGVGRIGGEIIAGPWIENGNASFIISFGVPADPSGTRTLREIAFDSEVVWTNTGGFATEAFTYRFYGGTLTQAADPLETAHFGSNAVAYRPQILIAFQNIPLANTKFGKIPYVAAVIADASGDDVNLGEAFTRLATSPWVGYTSSQFETVGITDGLVSGGLIFADQTDFLGSIQQFGRFYPNWNILQTDKLRIVDRGNTVTPDIVLTSNRMTGPLTYMRAEPNTVPRILELTTIDPDADYTIVPSRSSRPHDPVNVTASVTTDTAYLPAIMEASTRQAIVTFTNYREEIGRKKVSGTAMMYGLQMEPGDLIGITGIGSDFRDEVFQVIETLHGANYTVEFTAESFMNCDAVPPRDPYWADVVLLMGYEGADGSTGAPGMTDEASPSHGTATNPNSIQIKTAQKKFGSSSLQVPNVSGSVLTFAATADWRLSNSNSDQFTVEAWIYVNSFPSPNGNVVSGLNFSTAWNLRTLPGGEVGFGYLNSSSVQVDVNSSGASLSTGTWYHVAADKDAGGKIRVYKNGVMVASATPADSAMEPGTYDLIIGGQGLVGVRPLDGYLDELRVTKGIARYASDSGFTVPDAAFPRS